MLYFLSCLPCVFPERCGIGLFEHALLLQFYSGVEVPGGALKSRESSRDAYGTLRGEMRFFVEGNALLPLVTGYSRFEFDEAGPGGERSYCRSSRGRPQRATVTASQPVFRGGP
jgi:hypothetical protein